MEQVLRIEIDFPQEILFSLKKNKEEFTQQAKEILVFELFKRGQISLGKAAEICGFSEWEFMDLLGSNKISPFTAAENNLSREIEGAS